MWYNKIELLFCWSWIRPFPLWCSTIIYGITRSSSNFIDYGFVFSFSMIFYLYLWYNKDWAPILLIIDSSFSLNIFCHYLWHNQIELLFCWSWIIPFSFMIFYHLYNKIELLFWWSRIHLFPSFGFTFSNNSMLPFPIMSFLYSLCHSQLLVLYEDGNV